MLNNEGIWAFQKRNEGFPLQLSPTQGNAFPPRSGDESLQCFRRGTSKVCYPPAVIQKGWIIVEQVPPGQQKFNGLRYPRSAAIATREEAEVLKAAYPPEHGGEITVISISEFYSTRSDKRLSLRSNRKGSAQGDGSR